MTRSTSNSAIHWRQPPHGEAVTASASMSARPLPPRHGAEKRRALGADAERIRRVLDVHAGDDAAVAQRARPRRRGTSSRARRRLRPPPCQLEEFLVRHCERPGRGSRSRAYRAGRRRRPRATEWIPDSTRVWATRKRHEERERRDEHAVLEVGDDERDRHPAAEGDRRVAGRQPAAERRAAARDRLHAMTTMTRQHERDHRQVRRVARTSFTRW